MSFNVSQQSISQQKQNECQAAWAVLGARMYYPECNRWEKRFFVPVIPTGKCNQTTGKRERLHPFHVKKG